MSQSTPQQYANLASDAYEKREVTKPGESIPIGGRDYKVLAVHSNSLTGYQGTVYQDVKTNEIIVAHRGTESALDGVIDWKMVADRANYQTADAAKLTQMAIEEANLAHQKNPNLPRPHIHQVGHSLGGTHAQMMAYRFKQEGTTFNAYGAANLYGIPKGGNSVTNYMKATDPVAAGAPHYGSVTLVATPDEIVRLSQAGYGKKSPQETGAAEAVRVAKDSLDAHRISNFTGSRSVLGDRYNFALAEHNKQAIQDYYSDVSSTRSAIHYGNKAREFLTNPTGTIMREIPKRMRFSENGQEQPHQYAEAPSRGSAVGGLPAPVQKLYRSAEEHLIAYHQKNGQPIEEEKLKNSAMAIAALGYSKTMGIGRGDPPMLFNVKNGQYIFGERNPGLIRAAIDIEEAAQTPFSASALQAQQTALHYEHQEREQQIAQSQSRGMTYG